ncbi:redox-sensing transcriptional repressor Rex [Cellulomonas sp. CW35]|uniref:redox-sensing transcriptional repressor Rex n=1 Tax=unclassified Cellulomonas TaxID=2620175 RepID=UPI000AA34AA7|nr:redox-sensing transcriptional repressor Rex [Cellulomonas sp. PSBB021]ASR55378.1 redox-sensing transcriptional repressor Rex [Cellulomonas sp. PSBB021]
MRTTPDRAEPPDATVARLPGYLHALESVRGSRVVTSEELAAAAGVSPAQLRKDLSFLGSYGRRGVGYDVAHLERQLGEVLGVQTRRAVVIVGIGYLGHALASYGGFAERGFEVAALVDADPQVVGTTVAGLVVEPADAIGRVVGRTSASVGVIAVPAPHAQPVCDALVGAGVTALLTFAPRALHVPEHVTVRQVDVASELQILAFHDARRRTR